MIRKVQLALVSFALLISSLLSCFIPTTNSAAALNIEVVGGYTNVLEDLQRDENFNTDNYPIIKDDYSLQVIQIAESSDKELLVYVYQPSAEYENLIATSINISTGKGLELSFRNCTLELINNQGCFYKYRINDFIVSDISERHYEITSIYRAWSEKYDESIEDKNGNIINEVPFKVAKHWTFLTTTDKTEILCQDIETIEITSKYVGFVRYGDTDGVNNATLTDRHFVAFSTDQQIDKLMEADIYYVSQDVQLNYLDAASFWNNEPRLSFSSFGDKVYKYSYLKYGNKVDVTGDNGFWWGKTNYSYSWEEISNVDEFVKSVNTESVYSIGLFDIHTRSELTDEGYNDLEGKDWVLSFATTDYIVDKLSPVGCNTYHTTIGEVTILRLAFETNGFYYNLGVIDNKQTGDGNPDNDTKTSLELKDSFKIILAVLLLILLVVVLGPFLPTILSVVVWIFKLAFKLVIWLISLPIKLFKWLFDS